MTTSWVSRWQLLEKRFNGRVPYGRFLRAWCSHMQPRELTPSFLQFCPGILGISWDVLTIDD